MTYCFKFRSNWLPTTGDFIFVYLHSENVDVNGNKRNYKRKYVILFGKLYSDYMYQQIVI